MSVGVLARAATAEPAVRLLSAAPAAERALKLVRMVPDAPQGTLSALRNIRIGILGSATGAGALKHELGTLGARAILLSPGKTTMDEFGRLFVDRAPAGFMDAVIARSASADDLQLLQRLEDSGVKVVNRADAMRAAHSTELATDALARFGAYYRPVGIDDAARGAAPRSRELTLVRDSSGRMSSVGERGTEAELRMGRSVAEATGLDVARVKMSHEGRLVTGIDAIPDIGAEIGPDSLAGRIARYTVGISGRHA